MDTTTLIARVEAQFAKISHDAKNIDPTNIEASFSKEELARAEVTEKLVNGSRAVRQIASNAMAVLLCGDPVLMRAAIPVAVATAIQLGVEIGEGEKDVTELDKIFALTDNR